MIHGERMSERDSNIAILSVVALSLSDIYVVSTTWQISCHLTRKGESAVVFLQKRDITEKPRFSCKGMFLIKYILYSL